MKIYKNLFIFLLLFVQCGFARLQVLDTAPQNVELIKTLEMRFCYISFVKIDGKKYIIKQKKSDCIRKIGGVVRDAVTAHVAESLGKAYQLNYDLAHRVDVIPAGQEFVGKPRADWPATIHTIAPGKTIKDQTSRFDRMNIKQADIGFRQDMLPWMAKHPTLVLMVALDTFLCNHDRHRKNLFYNPKTDSICAIDMDSSWKYNLCALACENFTEMLHDQRLRLTKKELTVLVNYRKYLQFLIDNYTAEDIVQLFDYFTEKAGFVEGSELYTARLALELDGNRATIIQSYQDVQELVKILDELIEKHKEFHLRPSRACLGVKARLKEIPFNGFRATTLR